MNLVRVLCAYRFVSFCFSYQSKCRFGIGGKGLLITNTTAALTYLLNLGPRVLDLEGNFLQIIYN